MTFDQASGNRAAKRERGGAAVLVGELLGALEMSWARLGRTLIPAYLGAIFILLAATVAGKLRWSNSLYFMEDLKFAFGTGQGALTVVNALMLGAAGALLLFAAYQLRLASDAGERSRQRVWLPWFAFAALAVVLALDEVLMAHEYVTDRLDSAGVSKAFGIIEQDIFVFLIYGVVLVVVLALALPTIVGFGSSILPLFAFGLFMGLSQVADFVPWTELTETQQQILGPLEEALKCLGGLSLMIYGWVLSHDVIESRVRSTR